jgi:lipoyl(octanoyl) transferase
MALLYPRASALLYDLPHLTPYATAHAWQRTLFRARTEGPAAAAAAAAHPNIVLALEHAPVFTLGRAASLSDLCFPASPAAPQSPQPPPPAPAGEGGSGDDCDAPLPPAPAGFAVHHVERGGKVTYHGPGQLVVYPLLDLRRFRADLHWYVTSVEEVVIRGLASASGGATRAFRLPGSPGVWLGAPGRERKVAAVGMNSSKWFTQHGLAVNVCPDLAHFAHIVPCGIRDRAVTSLAQEAADRGQAPPTLAHVKAHVLAAFSEVFNCDLLPQQGAPVQGQPELQ